MYSDPCLFFQSSPETFDWRLETTHFILNIRSANFCAIRTPQSFAVVLFLIFHCRCYQRLGFRFYPLASNTRGMTVDIRMPDEPSEPSPDFCIHFLIVRICQDVPHVTAWGKAILYSHLQFTASVSQNVLMSKESAWIYDYIFIPEKRNTHAKR